MCIELRIAARLGHTCRSDTAATIDADVHDYAAIQMAAQLVIGDVTVDRHVQRTELGRQSGRRGLVSTILIRGDTTAIHP